MCRRKEAMCTCFPRWIIAGLRYRIYNKDSHCNYIEFPKIWICRQMRYRKWFLLTLFAGIVGSRVISMSPSGTGRLVTVTNTTKFNKIFCGEAFWILSSEYSMGVPTSVRYIEQCPHTILKFNFRLGL